MKKTLDPLDQGSRVTEVRDSCSIQYEGKMWIYGGFNNMRQIAELDGCGIVQRQGKSFQIQYC